MLWEGGGGGNGNAGRCGGRCDEGVDDVYNILFNDPTFDRVVAVAKRV